jgi:predicted regulator of Ras-like GTPase activity (Roadblock/LC7/MglB family)
MRSDIRPALQEVVEELTRLKDISAAAIVRRDGLVIAHDLPSESDARKIAAMSAAIVGAGEMAAEELSQGRFQRSIIRSDRGKILSTGAGEEAILVTLVREECNLGLILIALEKAVRKVQAVLSGAGQDLDEPWVSMGGLSPPGRGGDGHG